MSTTLYAQIKFKNSGFKYTYKTDIKDLVEGEKVTVPVHGVDVEVTFENYVPLKYVTKIPHKRITGRIAKIKEDKKLDLKGFNPDREKNRKRTNKAIDNETEILSTMLSLFPRGLTATQVGELMNANGYNWKPQSFTTNIKSMMKRNENIQNPQRNLYIHKKFLEVTV